MSTWLQPVITDVHEQKGGGLDEVNTIDAIATEGKI